MIVSLLLFHFAFRFRRFSRDTTRERSAVWNLLLGREPEAPLNGVARNRNHVNLRPPRVEYRNSHIYGATIFRPDWTIVTLPSYSHAGIRRRLSIRTAVSDPKSNAIYYYGANRQERFTDRFDETRHLRCLDWLCELCHADKCEGIEIASDPSMAMNDQIVASDSKMISDVLNGIWTCTEPSNDSFRVLKSENYEEKYENIYRRNINLEKQDWLTHIRS